jgi:hypothetical protein
MMAHMMSDEDVRRHIAGEVRAEVARQAKAARRAAEALGKSRQAFSLQWRGVARYQPEELLALANWLGVDVRQFLPPGYKLMVVAAVRETAEMAS